MEPNEESIRTLEMRIKRQLNLSLEKEFRPENIQTYVSRNMLQNGRSLTEETVETLRQNDLDSYQRMEDFIKLSKTAEVPPERAKSSYEKVVRLVEGENTFESGRPYFLNTKV